jgi:hypothetical protein
VSKVKRKFLPVASIAKKLFNIFPKRSGGGWAWVRWQASSFANFGLCVGLCGLQMCLLCVG